MSMCDTELRFLNSQPFPAEYLSFRALRATLVVIQRIAFRVVALAAHLVRGAVVFDRFLLSVVDPTGKDGEQQSDRLDTSR